MVSGLIRGAFLFFLFFPLWLTAQPQLNIQVAFLEVYNKNGELVRLEPGGRFAHVAISYKGGWLHSHPPYPVQWVPSLEAFGTVAEIIEVHHYPNYFEDYLARQIGKASSLESEWNDKDSTYCSKLVGKILGIPPRPNNWDAPIWRENPLSVYPLWGLSPDDIYEHLMANQNRKTVSYIPAGSCSQSLH